MTSIDKIFSRYPSSFIEKEFQKFFLEYHSTSPYLPHINNEEQFSLIRNKLFGQSITLQISAATIDTTTVDINNYSTTPTILQLTASTAPMRNHNKPYQEKMIIHYKHEKRFHSFKRDLHQIHDTIFHNTPVQDLKLIVGNRNRRDARHELIRKRPKRFILKNITKKRKKSRAHTIKHTLTKLLIYIFLFLARRRQQQTKSNTTLNLIPLSNST